MDGWLTEWEGVASVLQVVVIVNISAGAVDRITQIGVEQATRTSGKSQKKVNNVVIWFFIRLI